MTSIKVLSENCNGCGFCVPVCPTGAIAIQNGVAVIQDTCNECEFCLPACPTTAIFRTVGVDATIKHGAEAKHIAVYLDFKGGQITEATRKTLNKARELANMLGCYVFALAVGIDNATASAVATPHGVDKVMTISGDEYTEYHTSRYTDALENLVREVNPEILLFPHSFAAHDIAPRIAQRFGTGFAGGAVKLDLDLSERLLLQHVTSYGGKLINEYVTPKARPQIAHYLHQ